MWRCHHTDHADGAKRNAPYGVHHTNATLTAEPLLKESVADQCELSGGERFTRLIFKCDDTFAHMARSNLLLTWCRSAGRRSCAPNKGNDRSVVRCCDLGDQFVNQALRKRCSGDACNASRGGTATRRGEERVLGASLNAYCSEVYMTRKQCAADPNADVRLKTCHLWTRGEEVTEKIGDRAALPHLHVNGVGPLARAEQGEEANAHLHR